MRILLAMTCILYVCAIHAQVSYSTLLFGDSLSNNRGSASVVYQDTVWFAGTISDGNDGSDDIAVFRIAPQGHIIWQQVYGDGRNEFVNNMIRCANGNLYICGDVRDPFTDDLNGFIMALDTAGNLLWRTDHGDAALEEDFYGIDCLGPDAIAVTGFISSAEGTGNDVLLARYTTEGSLIDAFVWGDTLNDYGMGITALPGGHVVISGDRQLPEGHYNPFYAKITSENEILFDVLIESDFNSGCKNIHQISDGSLLICGETASAIEPQFDVFFVRADTTGMIQSYTQFPGLGPEAGYDIAELPDDRVGIVGFGYNITSGENDILFLIATLDGVETDRYYYGNTGADLAYDIQVNESGDSWISGFSSLDDATYFALIYQSLVPDAIHTNDDRSFGISVYPNPVSDCFTFSGKESIQRVRLYTPEGKLAAELSSDGSEHFCLPADLPAGMYLLHVETGNGMYRTKIIAG